jgi:hypothetical protein
MSIAIAITVTDNASVTKTTIPSPTGNRTMAATDKWVTDLAEKTRQLVVQQFQAIDPAANTNITVGVTVT